MRHCRDQKNPAVNREGKKYPAITPVSKKNRGNEVWGAGFLSKRGEGAPKKSRAGRGNRTGRVKVVTTVALGRTSKMGTQRRTGKINLDI